VILPQQLIQISINFMCTHLTHRPPPTSLQMSNVLCTVLHWGKWITIFPDHKADSFPGKYCRKCCCVLLPEGVSVWALEQMNSCIHWTDDHYNMTHPWRKRSKASTFLTNSSSIAAVYWKQICSPNGMCSKHIRFCILYITY